MTYSFEVNTRSQSLGIFGLSEDRTQRLELMLLLQEKYQMNSVQISDFLNSNNIKTPHNKTYNYKIVWSSIKKYKARLNRFKLGTIERVKETIYYRFD
jgi:biotin synthase-like enzyme